MILAIKAFFDSLTATMNTIETKINQQTTSQILRDKRRLKEASNITEDILTITDKYKESFEIKDLNRYERLKRKFLKLN